MQRFLCVYGTTIISREKIHGFMQAIYGKRYIRMCIHMSAPYMPITNAQHGRLIDKQHDTSRVQECDDTIRCR